MLKHQQERFQKLLQKPIDFESSNTRDMILLGIPSRFRSIIWPLMCRNRHGITKNFYHLLIVKANHIRNCPNEYIDQGGKIESLHVLRNDINRTFVELKLFRDTTDFGQQLEQMLGAWVAYRQDIGYIQGMSNVAGFIITQLKEQQAFSVFTTIVTTPTMISYYTFQEQAMKKFENTFMAAFAKSLSQLYDYFQDAGIGPTLYLFQWILTLFTKCLDFQIVARVWDILLLNEIQQNALIQVALAILHTQKRQLMTLGMEQILKYLKAVKVDVRQQNQFFGYLYKSLK